jgi:chromosome segregation ATPase
MTKTDELNLANEWLAQLSKESYLYDLLKEAIPLWEDYIRSDGFYCEPLQRLEDLKRSARDELKQLADESKQLEDLINVRELELKRMNQNLYNWHNRMNELADESRYFGAKLFKLSVEKK